MGRLLSGRSAPRLVRPTHILESEEIPSRPPLLGGRKFFPVLYSGAVISIEVCLSRC